jgi:hypothetical protein
MKTILLMCAPLSILLVASVAMAGQVIDVGGHYLLPNSADQWVEVSVSGGDAVMGLNFYAQVGDGNFDGLSPHLGPRITSVDILTGTIFAGNNTGQSKAPEGDPDPEVYSQWDGAQTTTATAAVPASGRVARVNFDTTGFAGGTWDFELAGTAVGDTDFADTPIAITNGSITITPEPSGLIMLAGALAAARKTGSWRTAGSH